MTAPAPSPDSPQSPQAGPPADKRFRKVYILWGVALTLLLALGLFCWLVVVPVWQVRTTVREQTAKVSERNRLYSPYGPGLDGHANWLSFLGSTAKTAVAELGGPDRAAEKLGRYLGLPRLITEDRVHVVVLLYHCGTPGSIELMSLLDDPDEDVRYTSAIALVLMGRPCEGKVRSVLERLAKSKGVWGRQAAREALERIHEAQRREAVEQLRREMKARASRPPEASDMTAEQMMKTLMEASERMEQEVQD